MPGRPRKGSWRQGWEPRPAFEPGNTVALVHGVHSDGAVAPVAEAFLRDLGSCQPDYLADRSFAMALNAWAKAEAQLLLYETWMDSLPEDRRYTAVGAQSPAIATWSRMSELAARHRARLGLDPVSRVRIGKALTSAGVDIARLAMMDAAPQPSA